MNRVTSFPSSTFFETNRLLGHFEVIISQVGQWGVIILRKRYVVVLATLNSLNLSNIKILNDYSE